MYIDAASYLYACNTTPVCMHVTPQDQVGKSLRLLPAGPSMFGVRPEWAANVAASIARNTTAVTAARLRDGLPLQRTSFADLRAAAADLRSGERTTLQVSVGSGNAAAPPDHMVIVARLAEDISWCVPMSAPKRGAYTPCRNACLTGAVHAISCVLSKSP